MIPTFSEKDPADFLGYEMNFADWLPAGDAITGATLAVLPAGLTLGSPMVASPAVRFYAGGGVDGVTYTVSATVTTQAGRTVRRSARLPVYQR